MAADPDFLQRLLSGGDPNAPGLLGSVNRATQPFGGATNLGLQMLANSGYSRTPQSFGQILGQSALNAQQVQAGVQEAQLKQQMMQAQLAALKAKPAVPTPPNIQEYEYAKQQGYTGSFDDWQHQAKQQPADVQEYEYAKKNGFAGSFLEYQQKKKDLGPMDELAKLTADHAAGRISDGDFKARRELMTTRAPNAFGAIGANDPKVEAAAKLIARYDQAPLTSMALRTPFGQAVTARVLELNPEYHGEEFPKRQAAYKAFSTGKQGDQVRSFNVGISHLNTAGDLAQALGNGDIRIINHLSQRFGEETGNPAPTNLGTAKEVIKAEVVKAISGSGGGVADRERALEGIDKASSPAQLQGAIEVAKKLMGGQLGGLRRQYKNSTGREDFETLLSPDAVPYLATKEGMGDENTGKKAPLTNAKGWVLHTDKNGSQAYVSPDGKNYEEVK